MSKYTFAVKRSVRDREYVGTCEEFPLLSWCDPDEGRARKGIEKLVAETVSEMRANGEEPPAGKED